MQNKILTETLNLRAPRHSLPLEGRAAEARDGKFLLSVPRVTGFIQTKSQANLFLPVIDQERCLLWQISHEGLQKHFAAAVQTACARGSSSTVFNKDRCPLRRTSAGASVKE